MIVHSNEDFVWVAGAFALLDVIVAVTIILKFRQTGQAHRNTIRPASMVLAAAVLSVLMIAKALLLRPMGLSFFGVMHLVYVDLVVAMPAIGLCVWWMAIRRQRETIPTVSRGALAIASLLLLGVPVGVYATFVEPFNLKVERVNLVTNPARAGGRDVHIAVLADIQMERVLDYHRQAVDRLMSLEPDIILIPGDFYQEPFDGAFERDFDDLRALLQRLDARGGVFFVIGDVDHREHVVRLTQGTRVRFLQNEIVRTRVNGRNITIAGLGLRYNSDASDAVSQLASISGDDDFRIVLTHQPDAALHMTSDSRVDLVVAGHTHGGQVRLPLFGPPITFSHVPRELAAGGLGIVNGLNVYVSRGVGWEQYHAPRIRFLCPPELSLLRLPGKPAVATLAASR
jgi:uncharacterized protein